MPGAGDEMASAAACLLVGSHYARVGLSIYHALNLITVTCAYTSGNVFRRMRPR
jgi:hypothetical protein